MEKTRRNRIVALLICVAVFVSLAISTVFIAKNAGHNCTSDHCAICVQIKSAEKQIKQMKAAVFKACVSVFCLYNVCKKIVICAENINCFTLINLKTELLN